VNTKPQTNKRRDIPKLPFDPVSLAAVVIGVTVIGLWIARLRGMIDWSWWAVLCLTAIGLFLIKIGRALRMPAVSEDAVRQAFSQSNAQHLRCLSFVLPSHWRVEKLQSGAFGLWIKEMNEWGWINVDVDWLWQTKIDTVEGYREYAEKFVREDLNGRIVRDEITTRWGVPAHEFEYTGKHSTGWKITIPYHGAEYGIQVSTKFSTMYPAAKLVLDQFLAHAQLTPPPLKPHTVFGGTCSVAVPPDFHLSNETADTAVWLATSRPGTKLSIRRMHHASGFPLTAAEIEALAAERPDLAEPFGTGTFSMKDLGISGFQTYQASKLGANGRCWFVAAIELVTGGRYLFIFDGRERNAAETYYMGHFRYVQISMEIIATMSESPVLHVARHLV
jgi:hypothetical protein